METVRQAWPPIEVGQVRGSGFPWSLTFVLFLHRRQNRLFLILLVTVDAQTLLLCMDDGSKEDAEMIPAAPDDCGLLEACRAGNRQAFGQIVERYQALICAVTYNLTGDLALSEDLAQETFLAAWQRLCDLREPAKLRAWLCSIARNLCANMLRRRRAARAGFCRGHRFRSRRTSRSCRDRALNTYFGYA
jgi:hypothetical protein